MKLKHIFLFTICVLLPNGLYSSNKTSEEKQRYQNNLVETWRKHFKMNNPIETMDELHLFINIMARPGTLKNELFVVEDRIGVNITNPDPGLLANEELSCYLANVLGINSTDIKIVGGFTHEMKTFRLPPDLLSVKDIEEKIIQRMIQQSSV